MCLRLALDRIGIIAGMPISPPNLAFNPVLFP